MSTLNDQFNKNLNPDTMKEEVQEAKLETLKQTLEFLKANNALDDSHVGYSFFVEADFNAEKALEIQREYSRELEAKYG